MKLTPEKIQAMYEKTEAVFRKIEADPDYPAFAAEFDREYEIARTMYKARTRAKLTQGEIAAKMGTTQSAVSRMEKGRVTYNNLHRYVEACGGKLKVAVTL